MTTTTEAPEFAGVACPPWCRRAQEDHDSADVLNPPIRYHDGPSFGPHLFGMAVESADAPGVLDCHVQLDADVKNITRHGDLLDLAAEAIAAARWLEAHR